MSAQQTTINTVQTTLKGLETCFIRLGLRWHTLPPDIRNEWIPPSLTSKCDSFFSAADHAHNHICPSMHPLCHLHRLHRLIGLCQTATTAESLGNYLVMSKVSLDTFRKSMVVPRIIVERQVSVLQPQPSLGSEQMLEQAMQRLDLAHVRGVKDWVLGVPMVHGWALSEEEAFCIVLELADDETKKTLLWMDDVNVEDEVEALQTFPCGALPFRVREDSKETCIDWQSRFDD